MFANTIKPLSWILGLLYFFGAYTVTAAETDSSWLIIKEIHFENLDIRDNADDILILEAPFRAEDAAVVPVTVRSVQPQTAERYIKNIHLIVDRNPDPYAANIHLTPELGDVNISTRIRIDRYTKFRAIAEMNDGSLHMVSSFVRASGGCSAPAGTDAAAAEARLGQMQIRMRQPTLGEVTQAQVIVSHPNYSGLQFDQQRRTYIPAHYVKKIDISYNDKTLLSVDAGISLSEDPSIRFSFTPEEHGTLKATVDDSKDAQFTLDKTL